MKITEYGHAVLIATIGVFCLQYNNIFWGFVGGTMIGFGLFLAKRSGEKENR